MDEIIIANINTERFNPFGATKEELVAAALDEAGLIKNSTTLNNVLAEEFKKSLFNKKENFKESTKLGSLLVSKGVITLEELDKALEFQRNHPEMRLGGCLLALGFSTHEEIERALNAQNNIRSDMQELDDFQSKISKIKERLKKNL